MNTTSKENSLRGITRHLAQNQQETTKANPNTHTTHTHTDLNPVPVLNCDESCNMPGMSWSLGKRLRMLMTPLTLFPSVFLHTCKRRVHIPGYSKTRSCIQSYEGCLKCKALTPREKIRIHLCCHWQRKPEYHLHKKVFQFGFWKQTKKTTKNKGAIGQVFFLAQGCLTSGQERRKCIMCGKKIYINIKLLTNNACAPHSRSLRKADFGNRGGRDKRRVAPTPSYFQTSMKSPQ